MTYEYDPDLPYVVVTALTGRLVARFAGRAEAVEMKKSHYLIIDTTPAPRVPEDAEFITWWSKGTRWYAEMYSGTWRVGRDSLFEAVEDLPGVTPATVFTVLDAREEEKG